jgi:hypothetical protein
MTHHVHFAGGRRRHIQEASRPPAPAPGAPLPADSSLAGFAARHDLDAQGMLRLAAQAGTRRLARATEADKQAAAAASDRLYDACYGAGAAAADRRRAEAHPRMINTTERIAP